MSDSKPKPIRDLRLSRVRAAIWQNATDKGMRYSVTFSKLYLDKENNWKDTTSFGKHDLLLLAEVARQAAGILYGDELEQEKTPEGESQE
jgi:hypothetical protein